MERLEGEMEDRSEVDLLTERKNESEGDSRQELNPLPTIPFPFLSFPLILLFQFSSSSSSSFFQVA